MMSLRPLVVKDVGDLVLLFSLLGRSAETSRLRAGVTLGGRE